MRHLVQGVCRIDPGGFLKSSHTAGFVLLATALSLNGCKKKATPEECDAEADRSVEFMKSDASTKADADFKAFRDLIATNCREEGQSSAFAHCTIDAANSPEAVACQLRTK
jgi:hypothetical protein